MIGSFWSQLKDGTIGDGVFPAYKINVIDDKGDEVELTDGYETPDGSLELKIDNPQLKFDVYYADPLFKDPPTDTGHPLLTGNITLQNRARTWWGSMSRTRMARG